MNASPQTRTIRSYASATRDGQGWKGTQTRNRHHRSPQAHTHAIYALATFEIHQISLSASTPHRPDTMRHRQQSLRVLVCFGLLTAARVHGMAISPVRMTMEQSQPLAPCTTPKHAPMRDPLHLSVLQIERRSVALQTSAQYVLHALRRFSTYSERHGSGRHTSIGCLLSRSHQERQTASSCIDYLVSKGIPKAMLPNQDFRAE